MGNEFIHTTTKITQQIWGHVEIRDYWMEQTKNFNTKTFGTQN